MVEALAASNADVVPVNPRNLQNTGPLITQAQNGSRALKLATDCTGMEVPLIAMHNLKVKSVDKLMAQGFPENLISVEYFLHMRYRGTDCALMCPMETTDKPEKLSTYRKDIPKNIYDRDEDYV